MNITMLQPCQALWKEQTRVGSLSLRQPATLPHQQASINLRLIPTIAAPARAGRDTSFYNVSASLPPNDPASVQQSRQGGHDSLKAIGNEDGPSGSSIGSSSSRARHQRSSTGKNISNMTETQQDSAPLGPAYITSVIKRCKTQGQLLSTLQTYLPMLNALHASAATTHAAQLLPGARQQRAFGQEQPQQQQHLGVQPVGPLLTLLLELQRQHMDSFAARQAANSLWALAKLHQNSLHHGLGVPTSLLQRLVDKMGACMHTAQPQELANAMWALVTLQLWPSPSWLHAWCSACDTSWPRFKPQELSTLLWGCGTLGWERVQPAWLERALQAQLPLLEKCGPQELVMGLWGLAQAQTKPWSASVSGASDSSSRSSSRTTKSAASQPTVPQTASQPSIQHVALSACNGQWGRAFAAAAAPLLPQFNGAELATLLSTLSTLRSPSKFNTHAQTHSIHHLSSQPPEHAETHATLYPPDTHVSHPSRATLDQDSTQQRSCTHSLSAPNLTAGRHKVKGSELKGETFSTMPSNLPRRLLKNAPLLSLALPAIRITARATARPRQAPSVPSRHPSPSQPFINVVNAGQIHHSYSHATMGQDQPDVRSTQLPSSTTQPHICVGHLQQPMKAHEGRHQPLDSRQHLVASSQPVGAHTSQSLHPGSYEQQPSHQSPVAQPLQSRPAETRSVGRYGSSTTDQSSTNSGSSSRHSRHAIPDRGNNSNRSGLELSAREACNLLRAAAGLQLKPGLAAQLWVEAMVECALGSDLSNTHDLVDTLHGAARLDVSLLSFSTLTRLRHAAEMHHHVLDAHGLVMCLWALARLRVMPSVKLLGAVQKETDGLLQQQHGQQHGQQQQQQQQQQLGQQQQQWTEQQHLHQQWQGRQGQQQVEQCFTPAVPSSSHHLLQPLPQPSSLHEAPPSDPGAPQAHNAASEDAVSIGVPRSQHLAGLAPSEVASLCWAFGVLRVRPYKKWIVHLLGNLWRNVHAYGNGELAQVVLALGRMRCRPPEEWADWLAQELHLRISPDTPSAQVVQLQHAVASCVPDSASLEDWTLSATEEVLLPHIQNLGPTELVSLVWACARMGRGLNDDHGAAPHPQEAATNSTDSSSTGGGSSKQEQGEEPGIELGALEEAEVEGGLQQQQEQPEAAKVLQQQEQPEAAKVLQQQERVTRQAKGSSVMGDSVSGAKEDGGGGGSEGVGSSGQKFGEEREGVMLRHSGHRLRLSKAAAAAVTRACSARLNDLNAQQFSMLLISVPRLGMWLPEEWLERRTFSRPQDLHRLSHQDLCILLYVCGKLHIMPPAAWLTQALQEVKQRAGGLNGSMVSGVLQGLSSLDYSPGQDWLRTVVLASATAIASMQAKKVTKVYAAAADLEPALALLWGHNFEALVSTQQQQWLQQQQQHRQHQIQSSNHGQANRKEQSHI